MNEANGLAAGQTSVLVVDDRPENLLTLGAILEPLDVEVVGATSGEDALKQLLLRDFAVILLDVQMPELDGFETAALIKRRERTSHVPIIFVTAISTEDANVFRGYSAGAVDYIFKPFHPEVLRSKVAAFVDLHRTREELHRREEELRVRELEEVRAVERRRYRELAEAMPQIVWMADATGRATYYNRRWFDYTGLDPETVEGYEWKVVVHPDDLQEAVERRRESLETGNVFETQYRFRAADGTYRWHLGRAIPIRDDNGKIDHWVGTATDIHDQKRIEETQRFLAEASNVLVSSLDYRRTLSAVADLAVPRVADWCAIDILEADGTVRQLAVEHVDETKVQLARELRERYRSGPDEEPRGALRVIWTREPELVTELSEEALETTARDDLHLDLLRQLELRSYICVPMVARAGIIGAITLIAGESGRRFDTTDLRLAEGLATRAALAVENARLYREAEDRAQAALALASVDDGVALVDGEGVVRLWNPAAARLTGLPETKVVGRPAAAAVPGWADLAPRIPVRGATASVAARAETLPLEIDGRELWLSISGVEIADGVVYAFRDLTDEWLLEKMKSDFVATVSHELRTPLAAIYGAAVTMRRGDIDLDPEMRERLMGIIAEEAERLAEIVNDILLASHLDSGQIHVSIQRCDARELAESVLGAAETHLPEGVTLTLEAPDELPPVAADPTQLRQVLANLVDNAVKYSPGGGPVRVALQPVPGRMRFAVSDRGVGIPVGETKRIFEKFYRLDPDMTRGVGGTGLGLYICRELVRRMSGKLTVASTEGEGSTFIVEIPLADGVGRPRKPAGAVAP